MSTVLEISLVACYARGAPRQFNPPRSGAQSLVRALRLEGVDLKGAPEALRRHGLLAESMLLADRNLLDWAESALVRGDVLTFESFGYPRRARDILGPSAPAVFWKRGVPPTQDFVAVVGSREVGPESRRFAEECARTVIELGCAVASGGAKGVDRFAAAAVARRHRTSAPLVEVLPHGIGRASPSAGCILSLAAPDEEFSAALAMERNSVLYAMSRAAIVVEARFKEGGAWHGAVEALRRRLTHVLVREDESSLAHRALAALGATPLRSPEDLGERLNAPPMQPHLVS